jgi:hypothetical protein
VRRGASPSGSAENVLAPGTVSSATPIIPGFFVLTRSVGEWCERDVEPGAGRSGRGRGGTGTYVVGRLERDKYHCTI